MKNRINRFRYCAHTAALALVSALTACGGSSSSGGVAPPAQSASAVLPTQSTALAVSLGIHADVVSQACTPQLVNWALNTVNCQATAPASNSAAEVWLSSTQPNTSGSARFVCTNGSWGEPVDASCDPAVAVAPKPAAPKAAPVLAPPAPASSQPVLAYTKLEYAQTHVLPESGLLSWEIGGITNKIELHLVAGRDALAMVDLSAAVPPPLNPRIKVTSANAVVTLIALASPNLLPATEANGAAYGANLHSATLSATLLKPGMQVQFVADNYAASMPSNPKVGLDSNLTIYTLPFYLFGANDANSVVFDQIKLPSKEMQNQAFARLPLSNLTFANHSAEKVSWPHLIMRPSNGRAAYKIINSTVQKDSYDVAQSVFRAGEAIKIANGDYLTNSHYSIPLVMLDDKEVSVEVKNFYGGSTVATVSPKYGDEFLHEHGHAFYLGHATDDYVALAYPYEAGSLKGSTWGYDSLLKRFQPTYLETARQNTYGCRDTPFSQARQFDVQGRCIKRDPMHQGASDRAAGDLYTIFADANLGRIQRHFEGQTTLDGANQYVFGWARILVDSASATGYSRWNTLTQAREAYPTVTQNSGLYGWLDGGVPVKVNRSVPVHTIVITYSLPGSPDASQIYPAISHTGNLPRTIDPTDAADRTSITPTNKTAANRNYCQASGCDYSLRVTYADDSKFHAVLSGAFHAWNSPSDGKAKPTALDATHIDSFKIWGINVPGDKAIKKIEVLDTPKAWLGLGAAPTVLLTR